MFIDPKDKRKVIIQSEDKKIPILKEDISIVFRFRSYNKFTIYINDFSWVPDNCFDSIGINNELILCSALEDLGYPRKYAHTFSLPERDKEQLKNFSRRQWELEQKLMGSSYQQENCSEKELRYYLKNRRWYYNYKDNMPAIETKSNIEQIMKMIGKDEFVKIPIEWSFNGTNNFREFLGGYKEIFEGYYRPKTPVIKPSDKKTHVHIHVHHVHNKNYTNKNINIDINQLIDKIISGLMDRIFAFGNIKGKTTDAAGKVSPDIEEAEIINATEEICRSLVPVHQQKDIRAVIVRRVNEIVRRQ